MKGRPGWRRVKGVMVRYYEDLEKILVEPDLAILLEQAILQAKSSHNRFGWANSRRYLVTADLDEGLRRLLSAEVYELKGRYEDYEETGGG